VVLLLSWRVGGGRAVVEGGGVLRINRWLGWWVTLSWSGAERLGWDGGCCLAGRRAWLLLAG